MEEALGKILQLKMKNMKHETSPAKNGEPCKEDIMWKIVWWDQTHVIDSCINYEVPPEMIASILVERRYYKDVKSAERRVRRHMSSDTRSKRLERNILTQGEYNSYLNKFNLPMPKPPYS